MSSVWGKNIKLSIFGESHGRAIGVNIDGLPPGVELDFSFIKREMKRRSPGRNSINTKRQEVDQVEILSGYFNNKTTGTPLCAIIWNTDKKSKDYDLIKDIMRPSHGDYTGNIRYKGYNDYRGGGHFSGRITAPLVFAGSIAKQILAKDKIIIGSHIYSIGEMKDKGFDYIDIEKEKLVSLQESDFPVLDNDIGQRMKELILSVKKDGDSVGGVVETVILNSPSGIGSPFFDSIESTIASLLFSVPGVKGVEFGKGFQISKMKGSQGNDQMYFLGEKIQSYTNNNGGILGGISSGMPIIFRTAFKPTPSIGKEQRTINISKRKNTSLKIEGRHDPCIVPRAVPVVESVAALALLDLMMDVKKYD
ncbi:chorismate synthase [Wansuia hejianensis]|uniref:Chorismate synthase n=1 Tax=Wansuia hejianensis TaxID=2763667 RepID=A0A926EWG3_9FIRM|nr:chorismate synthase [Wansuia hejianensis]MBC8589760.1 chorismate synthase [Wansuia hejianensis]